MTTMAQPMPAPIITLDRAVMPRTASPTRIWSTTGGAGGSSRSFPRDPGFQVPTDRRYRRVEMPARSSLALAEGADDGRRDPRDARRSRRTMTSLEIAHGAQASAGDANQPAIPEAMPRLDLDQGKPRLLLNVRLPGHPGSISPLVGGVMQLLRDTGGLAGREFAIETALREALANAIRHGCRNDASKVLECSVVCHASREIGIVVRDPGPGFDPASIPNPLCAENLYRCHGRGIYLMRQLMDDVWFERGGTEIHMRKRRG